MVILAARWENPWKQARVSPGGLGRHFTYRSLILYLLTPPTLGEKNMAYFGLQTKKLLTLIHVHPNGLFYGRLYLGR